MLQISYIHIKRDKFTTAKQKAYAVSFFETSSDKQQ